MWNGPERFEQPWKNVTNRSFVWCFIKILQQVQEKKSLVENRTHERRTTRYPKITPYVLMSEQNFMLKTSAIDTFQEYFTKCTYRKKLYNTLYLPLRLMVHVHNDILNVSR